MNIGKAVTARLNNDNKLIKPFFLLPAIPMHIQDLLLLESLDPIIMVEFSMLTLITSLGVGLKSCSLFAKGL